VPRRTPSRKKADRIAIATTAVINLYYIKPNLHSSLVVMFISKFEVPFSYKIYISITRLKHKP